MREPSPVHFGESSALVSLFRSSRALALRVALLQVDIKQAAVASAAARGNDVSQISVRVPLLASEAKNALQGTQYEYLPAAMFPRGAFCEFGSSADATGVFRTVQTGVDVIEEESPVAIKAINVQPIYPDDFTLTDAVGPGEKINVKLRDTSGAARVVNVIVKFTPL